VTVEDSKPGRHDCGADAAAYVLGALEPDEARAFSWHLDTCVVCRDEVAAFQQVADTMAMTPAQHRAPHGLKRRVMRAVRESEAETEGVAGSRRGWLGSGPWLSRPALATMAVLAIAVVVVGAIALSSGGSSGARVISASVTGSPGTAQLSVSGGRGDLIVRHFPQPSPGHIYEVWKLKRGARTPTPTSALFSVNSSGSGDVGVPGNLDGVTQVLVTQEPAGGSAVPTRAPVIVASLA
jgi:anti-sigma-K factor RskA